MTEHPYVHEVPGVCGGYPVLRNSRMPVRVIVLLARGGKSIDDIAWLYPHLSRDRIQGALDYYAQHPQRVDEDIERHERVWAERQGQPWPA